MTAMDENKLPSLHIRRAKKNRLPEQDDGLPSLTIQQKRKPLQKETTMGSSIEVEEDYEDGAPAFVSPPVSPVYTPAYQKPDRYQPQGGKWRLGRDIRTGDYVDAPQAGRREGLYIIGLSGTGKTGLIENLIVHDIKQNMGVCLLEPHGY